MRVTEGMKYQTALRSLGSLASRQADAQREASTGSRIDAPSADPIAAAQNARIRASLGQVDAHRTTVRSVQGDVETAEGALASAGDLLQRAREIAVQGSNGSLAAADRASLAQEVTGLRQQLIALGNTRGSSGYLFAGSKTNAAAFDSNGNFLGDDAAHLVDVGGTSPTDVSVSGARAFTAAGGRDIFQDLADLATALGTNDQAAVASSLTNVDAAHAQILKVRGEAGLSIDRLQTTDSALESFQVNLQKTAHDVADADPYTAYSALTTIGNSLDQAVAVTRQVLQTSALNRF
ncbi:MAG TPA: flagellar hook-associated protein FlgL [Polyangiaceae bacterium]|nr:flagellar hook-associated protein FlgL [Polyangiaceae bacterium]